MRSSSHIRPSLRRSPERTIRDVPGATRTEPTNVPLALPSSTTAKSGPCARKMACRTLTLASGSLTSLPAPRPMTTRDVPSNVSRAPSAERTTTVRAIDPLHASRGRDARDHRPVLEGLALDPPDDRLGHVATEVA